MAIITNGCGGDLSDPSRTTCTILCHRFVFLFRDVLVLEGHGRFKANGSNTMYSYYHDGLICRSCVKHWVYEKVTFELCQCGIRVESWPAETDVQ